jgi:hypothetical protein
MGRSSRRMTVALFTGIESLVDTLRQSHHISEWYIKAFTKLTDRHRRAFVVGGVASHLTDAVLCVILEDSRLPLLLPVIDAELVMETEWVLAIKPSLWAILGSLCNSPTESIRSECISVAMTSVSFTMMRLRESRKLPWSLIGDQTAEKLQELKMQTKPEGSVPGKIWELMQLGVYDGHCLAAVNLLALAPWGAAAVEEGHASTTMMLRKHVYDDKTLRVRATLAQARPLFEKCRLKKQIDREKLRVARLRKKQPQRVKGRHMLCRDLLRLAAGKRAMGVYKDRHIGKRVLQTHAKSWNAAPLVTKQAYEAEAAEERERKKQKLQGDIKERLGRIRVLTSRSEEATEGGPLRMSSCSFSISELAALEETWRSVGRTSQQVLEYEVSQRELVGEPDELIKRELEKHTPHVVAAIAQHRYSWLPSVCLQRDHFENVVFRWVHGDVVKLGKFIMAMQRPYIVGFLWVSMRSSAGPSGASSSSDDVHLLGWRHVLQFKIGAWAFSDEQPVHEEAQVSVLNNVVFLGGTTLASKDDWMPLQQFLDSLPILAVPARIDTSCPRARRAAQANPSLLVEHPWLLDHLQAKPRAANATAHGHDAARADDSGAGGVEPFAADGVDIEVADVWGELLERRRLAAAEQPMVQAFVWSVLGGAWTAEHKGVAYDAFKGRNTSARGKTWAQRYSVTSTASFSVKMYGERQAQMLVEAWVHRMNEFYRMWDRQMKVDFVYTDEQLASVANSADFEAARALVVGPVKSRFNAVAALVPR